MNQESIRRTTPTSTDNRHSPFFIRRYERVFGPEAEYVESVCANLIESRFGPGRLIPVIVVLTDRPEREPAVFYDLCEGEPNGAVPCYALSPLGRKGYQVVEAAYRRAKQMGLLDAVPNARNSTVALTPNHGRGSP